LVEILESASMPFSIKRTIYPLIVPAVLIILSALIIWKWTLLTQKVSGVKELKALFVILPVLPYVVLCIVFMMGWRYNNTGLILASVALTFSYLALSRSGPEAVVDPSTHGAVAFLLPLNLVAFTMLTKRRLFSIPSLFCVIFVAFQVLAVALVFHPAYSRLLFETGHLSPKVLKLTLDSGLVTMKEIRAIASYWIYQNDAPKSFGKDFKRLFSENRCGKCMLCRDACLVEAIKGVRTKEHYTARNEAIYLSRCAEKLVGEFSSFPDVKAPICGICIKICPFGQKTLIEDLCSPDKIGAGSSNYFTGQVRSEGGIAFWGDFLDMISGINSFLSDSLFPFFFTHKNALAKNSPPNRPTSTFSSTAIRFDKKYPKRIPPIRASIGTI